MFPREVWGGGMLHPFLLPGSLAPGTHAQSRSRAAVAWEEGHADAFRSRALLSKRGCLVLCGYPVAMIPKVMQRRSLMCSLLLKIQLQSVENTWQETNPLQWLPGDG